MRRNQLVIAAAVAALFFVLGRSSATRQAVKAAEIELGRGIPLTVVYPIGEPDSHGGHRIFKLNTVRLQILKRQGEADVPPDGSRPWRITDGRDGVTYVAVER